MLQLGTKYQIHQLRQEAMDRLVCYFPPRLEDFKNLHASDWEGRDPDDDSGSFPDGAVDICLDDTWTILVLARALDIPALLPPAFYLAVQYDVPYFFEDHIDKDNVHWTLNSDDTRRIIMGQEALRRRSIEFLDYFTDAPSSNCVDRQRCAKEQHRIRKIHLKAAHYDTRALVHAAWVKGTNVCSTCIDHFVSHYEEERTKTWSELAEYFDLKEVEWPVTDSTGDQVCLFATL